MISYEPTEGEWMGNATIKLAVFNAGYRMVHFPHIDKYGLMRDGEFIASDLDVEQFNNYIKLLVDERG
jgi:hypothetical protein